MGSEEMLPKVTAFVTRSGSAGKELLMFRHPYAGVQLPAGSVEADEAAETAVRREVFEETGLADVSIIRSLGTLDESRPGHVYVVRRTKVYARPDATSFDWAEFRRGTVVRQERMRAGFTQVTYEEWEDLRAREFITYRITGWVPDDALVSAQRRYLFHLTTSGGGPHAWRHAADNHVFEAFWARLDAPPPLVEPQQQWLDYVMGDLGYRF